MEEIKHENFVCPLCGLSLVPEGNNKYSCLANKRHSGESFGSCKWEGTLNTAQEKQE